MRASRRPHPESARLRASRRMAAGLMVRDARLRGLLTMRVFLALRTDLPAMANQIWASGLRQTNPTGKSLLIFRNCVKPRLQKYFCFPLTQISSLIRTVSFRQEGRCATSSTRGGMRWTLLAHLTNGADADGEVVWFRRPNRWRQACEKKRRRRCQKAWSPRRARSKP